MLTIEPICAFSDNYIWLLYDHITRQAVVVDPGDAAPVEAALSEKQLDLVGILITHHHNDHIGGLSQLLRNRSIPVWGPDNPAIADITDRVNGGTNITVLGAQFLTLAVPGHTLDHIAFYSADACPSPVVFCGDTLFAGGCGRIFEGTPAMMLDSLSELAALPAQTQVYCAHEYTLSNLAFAKAVEPNNPQLLERIGGGESLRQAGKPTVPSTLADERATNPFLRCDLPQVKQAAEAHSGTSCRDNYAVFATVRSWKDSF